MANYRARLAAKKTSATAFAAKRDSNEENIHIFFVNTTQQEKIDQLNAVAKHRRLPVHFLNVSALGKASYSPEELTGSFKDNKNVKLVACAKHFSQFSYEQVRKSLETQGFSGADLDSGRIRLYGCAEDSGIAFDRGGPQQSSATKKFVDTFFDTSPNGPYKTDPDKELVHALERFCGWKTDKHGKEKRKPFPGVEFAPVVGGSGGISNFFRLTNLTMKHLGLPLDPRHVHKDNILSFEENSVLGAFSWDPKLGHGFSKHLAKHPELMKESTGNSSSIYDGATAEKAENESGEFTAYHASIAKHLAARKHYISRANMEEIFQPPSRGVALAGLMNTFSIKGLEPAAYQKFVERNSFILGATNKDRDYKVSMIPGDGNYPYPDLAAHTRASIAKAGMVVSSPGEAESQTFLKQTPRLWSNAKLNQEMVDNNDAFIFMPSGAKEHLDKTRELEAISAAASTCIHKSLDPAGKNKLWILQEHEPGDHDRVIHQLNILHRRGAFGDRPSRILVKSTSREQTLKLMEDHRMRYRPVDATPQPDTDVPDWKDRTGKYNVCVFLSAAMTGIYKDKAEALGKRIQAAGMTLCYGAADRNMMGGVMLGAEKAAQKREEPLSVLASTTPIIETIECANGKKPKQIQDKDFYLAPNILKRKEFLFKNSHAFVVLEGGVGTLDELQMYMNYKDNDPEMVKNKPMVISESAYTNGGSMFKPLLDLYTGYDTSHLTQQDRKDIYERTGIMIMEAPTKIPEGSKKKLYQIEMDAAIEFLKDHRAAHFPHLVPNRDESKWVEYHEARSNSREASAHGH